MMADPKQTLHASCVAADGKAVLILGASGRGKSGLALQLMALGAGLVADDRVIVARNGRDLIASCPPQISGKIEARGIGILHAAAHPPAKLYLAVDLDETETMRLPPKRIREWQSVAVELVFNTAGSHFPAAIMQYLMAGRAE